MADVTLPPAQPTTPPGAVATEAHEGGEVVARPQAEAVGRGLFFALGAVLAGLVATVVVWRLGFIASITSFAMAAGAAWLYTQGAGSAPRKGVVPLVLMIVLGVVASFFAVVASDAWDAYDVLAGPGSVSRFEFIRRVIVDLEVLGSYGKDMAFFAGFAVLGIFGIVRRLMGSGGAPRQA